MTYSSKFENDEKYGSKNLLWRFRLVALGIVAFITASNWITIDQVTRATGIVITDVHTQLIQPADPGVIAEIHVKEGETVKAGQLLITLEKERAEAAVSDISAKVAALEITLARLTAEAYGHALKFPTELLQYKNYIRNQTNLYNKRKTAFQDDINALQKIHKISQEELEINLELENSGDVSRPEVLRLQRSVADINAQMINKQNKYFQDVQAEMTKAQEELSTQLELLKDRRQILDNTVLSASIDGIVNNIRVNTIGGVVRAGETLIDLLPLNEKLIVEAKIPSSEIASVKINQEANIKIDAYDSSIFGSIQGLVSYISPDILTEENKQGKFSYYKVKIDFILPKIKNNRLKEINIQPGLSASVDIKATERTLLSYLTKPINKTFESALGER